MNLTLWITLLDLFHKITYTICMRINDLIDIVTPYCDKIIRKSHFKLYPKNTKKVIIVASSPSDRYYYKQVYRDFRRLGIIIKELNG